MGQWDSSNWRNEYRQIVVGAHAYSLSQIQMNLVMSKKENHSIYFDSK